MLSFFKSLLSLRVFFIIFACLHVCVCAHMDTCVQRGMHGAYVEVRGKTTCKHQLFPFTIRVPGVKLRKSGLLVPSPAEPSHLLVVSHLNHFANDKTDPDGAPSLRSNGESTDTLQPP